MSPEDEKRFRLIIREEIRSAIEGISLFGPSSFCGGNDEQLQRSREFRELARQKAERNSEKLAAKMAKKAASN